MPDLYRFDQLVSLVALRYTSAKRNVTIQGAGDSSPELYTAQGGLSRTLPKRAVRESGLRITMPSILAPASEYIDNIPIRPYTVTLMRMDGTRIVTGTLIAGPHDITEGNMDFTVEVFGRPITTRLPARVFSPGCMFALYDAATCGILESASSPSQPTFGILPFKLTITLSEVVFSNNNLTLTHSDLDTHPDEWFTAGEARINNEVSQIIKHDGTAGSINILTKFTDITTGPDLVVVAGCKKRFTEDCKGKFANEINFGGFPFTPPTNPSIRID